MPLETVLAGNRRGEPAIDLETGKPLTMEELLRRRGMLAVNDVPSYFQPEQASSSGATSSGESSIEGALRANSSVNSSQPTTVGTNSVAASKIDPNSVPIDKRQLEGMDEASLSSLQDMLIGAGATAAATLVGAYLLKRRGRGTPLQDVSDTVANSIDPREPIDAEFYPIDENKLPNRTSSPLALELQQRALPAPNRTTGRAVVPVDEAASEPNLLQELARRLRSVRGAKSLRIRP